MLNYNQLQTSDTVEIKKRLEEFLRSQHRVHMCLRPVREDMKGPRKFRRGYVLDVSNTELKILDDYEGMMFVQLSTIEENSITESRA